MSNRKPRQRKMSALARYELNTKPGPHGCILWTGDRGSAGGAYGRVQHERKRQGAHRFAYELFVGPIPAGLVLDHICRTPLCVNPEHLEAVTQAENNYRGIAPTAVNAGKTVCVRGHDISSEDAVIYENGGKRRRCRACRMLWRHYRLLYKRDVSYEEIDRMERLRQELRDLAA